MKSLVELIADKRDGKTHSNTDIRRIIDSFVSGEFADYQLSAWLMAVFLRGMTDEETVSLTEAMLHSGDVLDLSHVSGFKVDKHSTGGVGDKVSICLAPLVASCGVRVPMVSGRGLGHTGGTLDKLEAIPGFSVNLSSDVFARIVGEVGTSMIGQTARIAPADKRIYALRDVTSTVESIPLIVASILSKKLAEGIDGLVLDVKVGRGAFMKSEEAAHALASALVRVGTAAGKSVTALLTAMDEPLGHAVGNANETKEAIEVLKGGGPEDLIACTLALGAEMLVMGKAAKDQTEAEAVLRGAIRSGQALRTMEKLIEAHGGDPRVLERPDLMEESAIELDVLASRSGTIHGINALEIGLSAVSMGAGRTRADQAVDHGVGIVLHRKVGAEVRAGDRLATLRVRDRSESPTVRVLDAFDIQEGPAPTAKLIRARLGS